MRSGREEKRTLSLELGSWEGGFGSSKASTYTSYYCIRSRPAAQFTQPPRRGVPRSSLLLYYFPYAEFD